MMSWRNDQVSEKETDLILKLAEKCLNLSGDFVEMGCYKGDTSLLLAELLRDYNKDDRGGKLVDEPVENYVKKLWIYDSFEGLPEKSVEDESMLGANFKKGELLVTKREVKLRFLRASLPVPIIKKAWFDELNEEDLPGKIAFAFLDGDLYKSMQDSLRLVGPKMVSGGIIVIHDYNNPALPGVKKAVDEWIKSNSKENTWKMRIFESMVEISVI